MNHEPVLLKETVELLACRPGKVYVDATVGGGGHGALICKRIQPDGVLIGIDCDDEALQVARQRLSGFGESVYLVKDNFVNLKNVLKRLSFPRVDGIMMDLGVSGFQIDQPHRGFSFQHDTVLDMRMDKNLPKTAADLLNELPEEELRRIIKRYGEERWASRIARFIVRYRKRKGSINRSSELVNIIKAAIPERARRTGGHPARRTFQALRIAVNDELKNLQLALNSVLDCLNIGGRLCILSYHSLEDRIVKRFLRREERGCICPAGSPVCRCGRVPRLRLLVRNPITPSAEELKANPRARSAKLRAAEKIND